jgi:phage-related protein
MSKTLFLFTLCVALFANTYAQDGSVASDAASGLDTAADAVGSAVSTAADATADGLSTAVNATAGALNTAADAVTGAVDSVQEAVGRDGAVGYGFWSSVAIAAPLVLWV